MATKWRPRRHGQSRMPRWHPLPVGRHSLMAWSQIREGEQNRLRWQAVDLLPSWVSWLGSSGNRFCAARLPIAPHWPRKRPARRTSRRTTPSCFARLLAKRAGGEWVEVPFPRRWNGTPAAEVEQGPAGSRSFFGGDTEPWWVRWLDATDVRNSIFGRGCRWRGWREPADPRCVRVASVWVERELAVDTREMRVPRVARRDLDERKIKDLVTNAVSKFDERKPISLE